MLHQLVSGEFTQFHAGQELLRFIQGFLWKTGLMRAEFAGSEAKVSYS